jgi:hypothetical protein
MKVIKTKFVIVFVVKKFYDEIFFEKKFHDNKLNSYKVKLLILCARVKSFYLSKLNLDTVAYAY